MSKQKRVYICTKCDAKVAQWSGRCGGCGAWNTLTETHPFQAGKTTDVSVGLMGFSSHSLSSSATLTSKPVLLSKVESQSADRMSTQFLELDRVLGGGLVPGSVILLGGDPGVGKSTLLLQVLSRLTDLQTVLYVTGEESLQQISLRARRLGLSNTNLQVLSEVCVEKVITAADKVKPAVLVLDSIQTAYTATTRSVPGSVSQVRDSAACCVQWAKQTGTVIVLVGHVTKEGNLAGPRILEHMVDTVLYFEGERGGRWRLIRAVKNRFGAVNELGIFAMTHKGLREVSHPSSIFLSRDDQPVSGSVVMPTWEGSRPLLVEVQALVDDSKLANPRRVALGLEANRLSMLLAVLHRHGDIATYDKDIFVNVVGGIRINETASDLAVLFAIISSLRDFYLPKDLIVFGEMGLAGEIRPVQNGQERIREAAKHGFKKAIVPKANVSKSLNLSGFTIYPASHLSQALAFETGIELRGVDV